MWEVTYTIKPDGGRFDRAEQILYDHDVVLETVRSIEFLTDGSIVIVYEIDGNRETLKRCLNDGSGKVLEFAVSEVSDPLVAQIRFIPDHPLDDILRIHRSYGVTVVFPIHYVHHDPFRIELTEIGPREELHQRIQETRTIATVGINRVYRHEPASTRYAGVLTERQQDVLEAAIEAGYYRIPRETSHEELAETLNCSSSMVGQHLRRIERRIISALYHGGSNVNTNA